MRLRALSALFVPALALVTGQAGAADYAWPVVRVVDGDTVAVDASEDLPPELADLRVRLRGVDTPEKGGRAKCPTMNANAGQAATAFTEKAVAERIGRRGARP